VRLEVRRKSHAGIRDKQTVSQLPTLQIRLDMFYHIRTYRVFGKHPIADRKTVALDCQPNHQLRRIVMSIFLFPYPASGLCDIFAFSCKRSGF